MESCMQTLTWLLLTVLAPQDIDARLEATCKAVRARTSEILKKESGVDCPHAAGACTAAGCGPCAGLQEQVFAPLLKERAASRTGKGAAHGDGPCTLVSGPLCAPCVEELSTAAAARIQACVQEKMAPTLAAAKEKIVARAKAAGKEPCACVNEGKACADCAAVKKQVLTPILRERVASNAAPHDGAPCTLMAGQACGPCADRIAAAAWAAIQAKKK